MTIYSFDREIWMLYTSTSLKSNFGRPWIEWEFSFERSRSISQECLPGEVNEHLINRSRRQRVKLPSKEALLGSSLWILDMTVVWSRAASQTVSLAFLSISDMFYCTCSPDMNLVCTPQFATSVMLGSCKELTQRHRDELQYISEWQCCQSFSFYCATLVRHQGKQKAWPFSMSRCSPASPHEW